MKTLGTIRDRHIVYVERSSETAWYKAFPQGNWLLFVITDHQTREVYDEVCRRALEQDVVYVHATGREGEFFHDWFDEALTYREVEGEYTPSHLVMTTWDRDLTNGFWFAAIAAYAFAEDAKETINQVICLDLEAGKYEAALVALTAKINGGWLPPDT